jgi:hypothetical protein
MLPNGQSGTCNMTLLAPALYYHMRTPPVYTYGYQLRGLPCGTLKSSDAVAALRRPGTMLKTGERFAMTYGLWVMPTLPGVGGSTAGCLGAPCGQCLWWHGLCSCWNAPAYLVVHAEAAGDVPLLQSA